MANFSHKVFIDDNVRNVGTVVIIKMSLKDCFPKIIMIYLLKLMVNLNGIRWSKSMLLSGSSEC